MIPPGAETVLVRYGEISVKSARVQDRMERQLADNMQAAIDASGLPGEVSAEHTRLYVETDSETVEAVSRLCADVFGVVSASPTRRVEPELDAICDVLAKAAVESEGNAGQDGYEGGTFAVRARRAGPRETHPFSSTDIETEGGAAIWETATDRGIDPAVDLNDPDVTFYVECRPTEAFVFLDKHPGPGGLPVGTQEPLVALVSGGIDSPVAAWLAMKRGCPVYPLYVDLGQYGGVDHRLRTEQTVSRLQAYAPNMDLRLRVADGGPGIDRIAETTDHARMVLLRRFFFRIAEQVADSLDAVGIVTGESIGQKSSQTSANLSVSSAVTTLPIHRPLVTADKTDIMDQAREIGTYHDSTINAGCNRIAPDRPATRANPGVVADLEPDDIDEYVTLAVDNLEVVDCTDEGPDKAM